MSAPAGVQDAGYGYFLADFFALRVFLPPFAFDAAAPAIRKSSAFLPDLIAAASQRGFNPRPAQVSAGSRDCGIWVRLRPVRQIRELPLIRFAALKAAELCQLGFERSTLFHDLGRKHRLYLVLQRDKLLDRHRFQCHTHFLRYVGSGEMRALKTMDV